MNQTDFIHEMAVKLDISFKEAKNDFDTILECITTKLEKGEQVKLVDFGSFEVVKRAPKKGHNPHTHTVFDIPACNQPIFKPGKALKELIKAIPD